MTVGGLSPTTRTLDAVRKATDHARVGVEELWLVDPDEPAVLVLRRPAGTPQAGAEFEFAAELDANGTLASPLLAGLAVKFTGPAEPLLPADARGYRRVDEP